MYTSITYIPLGYVNLITMIHYFRHIYKYTVYKPLIVSLYMIMSHRFMIFYAVVGCGAKTEFTYGFEQYA